MDETIRPYGIPWTGRKRPGRYRYFAAVEDGRLRILSSGRVYEDNGFGWRVLNKPVSRRKRKILARRQA